MGGVSNPSGRATVRAPTGVLRPALAPLGPPATRRSLRSTSLGVCGIVGFLGSACVLLGVAQAGSPFSVRAAGAWFFATSGGSRRPTSTGFLGVMLVYAGIVLMLGAWFELVRTVRRQPSIPMARLVAILVAWVAPVLVMPPVFSRDVYSYAAQGEMVQRGLNPYARTPSALRGGRFLDLVDPLWRHVPAPYGPAWERFSGAIVALSHHDVWLAAAGFRLVALAGLGLIAWAVPSLARSIGRPGSVAFALAALNPVVLLVLVGGAHNDALMLGLLVAGCALPAGTTRRLGWCCARSLPRSSSRHSSAPSLSDGGGVMPPGTGASGPRASWLRSRSSSRSWGRSARSRTWEGIGWPGWPTQAPWSPGSTR